MGILALVFLLIAPGYVTWAACSDPDDQTILDGLTALASWLVMSLVVTSVGALVLAEVGRFYLSGIILLVLGFVVALLLARRPSLEQVTLGRRLRWDRQALLLGTLLLAAGWLFLRPFEVVMGGRDGGVYVNTGAYIARTGGLLMPDPFFASLPGPDRVLLQWAAPWRNPSSIWFKYPGFYWIEEQGVLYPQFFHLYPALLAVFHAALGLPGTLYATPWLALCGLLSLYLLGRLLFGSRVGFLATALLAVNPGQVWFARYPNAEIYLQVLILVGLSFWVLHMRHSRGLWAMLAGVAFGAALFAKVEAWFLIIPLMITLAIMTLAGSVHGMRRFFVPFALLATLCVVYINHFAWPYFRMAMLPSLGLSPRIPLPLDPFAWLNLHTTWGVAGLGRWIAVAVTGLVLLSIFWARFTGSRTTFRRRLWFALVTHQQLIGWGLAAALVLVSVYLYFLAPAQVEALAGLDAVLVGAASNQDNLVQLGWYLTPLGLGLAIAGAAVVLIERWDRETLLPILVAGTFTAIVVRFFTMGEQDHVWAVRRHVSVLLPFAALFAAYAAWRIGTLLPDARLRLAVPLLLVGVVVTRLMQVNWPLIRHQEFQGAIAQVESLARLLPEGEVVVVFDGSPVANLLAPPLSFLYGRETVAFWPNEGEPPIDSEIVAHIVAMARKADRPVILVSTAPELPTHPSYGLRAVQQEVLTLPVLERTRDRLPQAVETWILPYRLYAVMPAGETGYEAEAMPGLVGRIIADENASWGLARYADPAQDPKGTLVYGPYVTLPPGYYRAAFRLALKEPADAETPVVVLDVAANVGQTELARWELSARDFDSFESYQNFSLKFETAGDQPLEFRVFFLDQVAVAVDGVEVHRASR